MFVKIKTRFIFYLPIFTSRDSKKIPKKEENEQLEMFVKIKKNFFFIHTRPLYKLKILVYDNCYTKYN
jgi:hypothetical protein